MMEEGCFGSSEYMVYKLMKTGVARINLVCLFARTIMKRRYADLSFDSNRFTLNKNRYICFLPYYA